MFAIPLWVVMITETSSGRAGSAVPSSAVVSAEASRPRPRTGVPIPEARTAHDFDEDLESVPGNGAGPLGSRPRSRTASRAGRPRRDVPSRSVSTLEPEAWTKACPPFPLSRRTSGFRSSRASFFTDLMVDRFPTDDDPFPMILLGDLAVAGLAHPPPRFVVAEELGDRARELGGIAVMDEEPVAEFLDQAGRGARGGIRSPEASPARPRGRRSRTTRTARPRRRCRRPGRKPASRPRARP